jgi:hypothetical protein
VYGPYRGASGRGSELGAFTGFKARFHGEEVASYEVEERLVYLLYRCGWGDYDGYRVHKTDERNPFDPEYELTPIDVEDPSSPNTEYHSLYEAKEIVSYLSDVRPAHRIPQDQGHRSPATSVVCS